MAASGPPMAVAPYEQVRAVIEYATSVIPPAKILMGMSLYGYDWRIPWQKGQLASGIANHSAESLAISEQVPILWGQQAVSPYFRYQGSGNATREVWFDDAMSVAAKMNLVYEFGLRGLSWWVLGNEFPQAWQLVRDTFEVKKI